MTTPSALPDTARAVRFDRYGGRDVLQVQDVPMPQPGAGEVLVAVRAAGINPGEAMIRQGLLHDRLPATFPSGQGTDFAGTVAAIGDGVADSSVGDEVLGYSWKRSSHATHVVVPAGQVVPKPEGLPWEVAGALDVAGTTAWAVVRGIDPVAGETVAVSAATGGVGTLVVQLLVARGVHVLGIASARSAGWLADHGVTPVEYGPGLADRLRAAAPDGVDGFIDLFGPEYLHLAAELGVPADRTDTIVFSDAAAELGIRVSGAAALTEEEAPQVLQRLAGLLQEGAVEMPIAGTYPLDRVADAFEDLERRHSLGKIVLIA
ncbi:NADP-dependent oxidoreductase [Amnibacterium endophyticum]|uniref:NADP-dependent oxidoreductase n=1 Tax=Amnibacterium endophyticum TaxID=2109337 RepID=A0ABW4LJQ3_9MICO